MKISASSSIHAIRETEFQLGVDSLTPSQYLTISQMISGVSRYISAREGNEKCCLPKKEKKE